MAMGQDHVQRKKPKQHSRGSQQHRDQAQSRQNSFVDNEKRDVELNPSFPERFNRVSRQKSHTNVLPQKLYSNRNDGFDLKLNPKVRQYLEVLKDHDKEDSQADWKRAPEIPTNEEVNLRADTVVNLPANRIHRPYKSVQRYLKTQYTLLREDAVSPLRDALDVFKKNPDMREDQNVSIYTKVHIVGLRYSQHGIAIRIKFSTDRIGKRILWSSSKRLMSGSIVALSPSDDNFNSHCVIAIVAARPLELVDQSPPEIEIYCSRPNETEIDPHKEFVMVEAKSGYFEAHRYTLKGLQQLSVEAFPLSANVTSKDLAIDPPNYLMTKPRMDLSAISSPSSESTLTNFDILESWPEATRSDNLDSTQLEALHRMLTKSLAIIQGPPGTGKTHVSVIALKILMQNRASSDPPIIVAAQTNHALDQLLEHVSEFCPEYIRLGGRSTSSNVKKRALYEIRKEERIGNIPGSGFIKSRIALRNIQDKFRQVLEIYDKGPEPISAELFHRLGVLNDKQKQSLEDAVSNWISVDTDTLNPMRHWMHRSLLPFQSVYHEEQYGFEEAEEDLEFEQLKECEAEYGVTDVEDIEMLDGDWQALSDTWTVVEPSNMDFKKAAHLLETCDDLWQDVPDYLRGAFYWVMRQRATANVLSQFRELAAEYDDLVHETKIGKWEKDAVYLARANIIGMTTTGLSKYRALISSLVPKIVLIEEAAEIIEAPVAVACLESLEHLILVGDHLQLRGHCAVPELEGPDYNLNISMFERLIKMDIPFTTLLKQRRMRPEFRMLISSLYPKLVDHPDVLNRHPPEWGTGQVRSFFFTHRWLEGKDDSSSTFNEQEAAMVAKFYRHLIHNGVPPHAITILTFYHGHRKKLLKEIMSDPVSNIAYVNVRTVDSYQGKESSIVILSLARNNLHRGIGFLDNANRVCVALSRARDGFYIFGNADMLIQNPLWHDIVSQMTVSKRIGDRFPVRCSKHSKVSHLQYPNDWDTMCPAGGCDGLCGEKMPCGHICDSICHAYSHDMMLCPKTCDKNLACGHFCGKKCHEKCSCGCDDYHRLTMATIHGTDTSVTQKSGSLIDSIPETGAKQRGGQKQESHGSRGQHDFCSSSGLPSTRRTHYGEQVRGAGQGRSRFVQDFQVGLAKQTIEPSNTKVTEDSVGEMSRKTETTNLLDL